MWLCFGKKNVKIGSVDSERITLFNYHEEHLSQAWHSQIMWVSFGNRVIKISSVDPEQKISFNYHEEWGYLYRPCHSQIMRLSYSRKIFKIGVVDPWLIYSLRLFQITRLCIWVFDIYLVDPERKMSFYYYEEICLVLQSVGL